MTRRQVSGARRWVIKVGSALVTAKGQGLDLTALQGWGDQIARLRKAGCEVVLVSSGAVAEGMARLGWRKRPHAIHELQAAAAVGQMGLVQAYETCFRRHNLHAAQVLLTHDDLVDRKRYLNARSTLRTLIQVGVIPVVNENDTVASNELRLGDNDTLGALVANLVEADLLVILTDTPGLYDRNPRLHADAVLISEGRASDPALRAMAGPSDGTLGRGGMITKVEAARKAARSGATTLIVSGDQPDVIDRLHAGETLGTLLLPDSETLVARKQWLASQLQLKGVLCLDEGAVKVLKTRGSSLLAVGVTEVRGEFQRGDMVSCIGPAGEEVARGLVNYSAAEARQIRGRPTREIEKLLGYVSEPELINRDDMVLLS